MKAPIVSRKHIVQHTQFIVPSSGVTVHTDAFGLAVQNVNAAFEVIEGSVIKAIYVEIWLLGNEPGQSTFVLIVEKAPSGVADPLIANMTTLDAYDNKKNILFTSQGVIGENSANPTPVVRQWIKIPKGKQRFGLQDRFRVCIAAIGVADLVGCGVSIYKSYQ